MHVQFIVENSKILNGTFIIQVKAHLKTSFAQQSGKSDGAATRPTAKVRRTVVTRIHEAVKAIALCHNVTQVYEVWNVWYFKL